MRDHRQKDTGGTIRVSTSMFPLPKGTQAKPKLECKLRLTHSQPFPQLFYVDVVGNFISGYSCLCGSTFGIGNRFPQAGDDFMPLSHLSILLFIQLSPAAMAMSIPMEMAMPSAVWRVLTGNIPSGLSARGCGAARRGGSGPWNSEGSRVPSRRRPAAWRCRCRRCSSGRRCAGSYRFHRGDR